MTTLIVQPGNQVVVNGYLSVSISRIQGDKAYLAFDHLGGKSIRQLEFTPTTSGGANGHAKSESGERTGHQQRERPRQQNGQNHNRPRKEPVNPYGMGKWRRDGKNHTGKRATNNRRR